MIDLEADTSSDEDRRSKVMIIYSTSPLSLNRGKRGKRREPLPSGNANFMGCFRGMPPTGGDPSTKDQLH